MDAVVLGGGIPQPDEPLYSLTQGKPKALLDVCGKPMIQWVLDALQQAQNVENIVVIGLPAESGVGCPKVRAFLPNQHTMVENIIQGTLKLIELNPAGEFTILASADVPAVTAEMIDWVAQEALRTSDDIYYFVIERGVMEKRFPGSKRSYTRLKDVEVCGGDVNVIRSAIVHQNPEIWERLTAARKNVFKQAALIGLDTLILLLLRQITLEQAVHQVAGRLKVKGRAVLSPYAEIGMDVDKPFQYELVCADLAQRRSAGQ